MKRILIVDDIPQNLYMLSVMLKTNGYEVVEAANGIEALELARQDPPDMIVSDILMPGMDGFALCRTWKSDERLKSIPFVVYTATYTDPKDEKLALDLGADRFLVKPVEPDELLAAISDTLITRTPRPSAALKKDLEEEEVFFKQYNHVLVHKLEDKMLALQKSNHHLSALYKASCDILTVNSPLELIKTILRAIVETAGYQQANFYTFDESQNKLILTDMVGETAYTFEDLREKLMFTPGESRGIVGAVAKTKKSKLVPDTSKEPDWISLDSLVNSALFTPVLFEKKLFGVIGLFSFKVNAFTREDENQITVLANSLAVSIENIHNLEKVHHQLERISTLHFIDNAINSSLDLRNTLAIILKYIIEQLKVDAADILLCRYNDAACEYAGGRGFLEDESKISKLSLEKNLARKVALDQKTVHLTHFAPEDVSPDYARMWNDERFQTYFGVPLKASGKTVGVLELFLRSEHYPDGEWLDYLETMAGQTAIAVDKGQIFEGLQRSNLELSLAYDATIRGWSRALDMRDQETEGHTQRVTEMTVRLAESMGFTGEQIVQVRRGALLHDIGKLSVPDAILLKEGELTPEEMVIMRRHAQAAFDLLKPISYLQPALDIPYCHHERWDGSGYPRGLKGEEIPLAARIFAIVDVYDALRSARPYRDPWPQGEVLEYLREQSGKHFDPGITGKFIKMISLREKE
jgi:response regulator RpfG family c-di-GMP phosphodiesterase